MALNDDGKLFSTSQTVQRLATEAVQVNVEAQAQPAAVDTIQQAMQELEREHRENLLPQPRRYGCA